MICWKIRIFAYWTTPSFSPAFARRLLWFAEKFVSLLIEQHLSVWDNVGFVVVICWKIRIFAYWTTPNGIISAVDRVLWFAEKFVSLLIEQHRHQGARPGESCCDLLKNSYLCLLNNTEVHSQKLAGTVVICWKIRIFAYWTTPPGDGQPERHGLWFAEKFVSLLIEQHPCQCTPTAEPCCDLLKNSYLCLLNNTTFAVGVHNTPVVICWKIRIFAYWTTPLIATSLWLVLLWFAEKFVSLLIEQHLYSSCFSR